MACSAPPALCASVTMCMHYLFGIALATFDTRLSSCRSLAETRRRTHEKGSAIVDTVLTEWLSLIIRWLHVVAGIAWIGSSFYFIHLDLSLKSRADLPAGRARATPGRSTAAASITW